MRLFGGNEMNMSDRVRNVGVEGIIIFLIFVYAYPIMKIFTKKLPLSILSYLYEFVIYALIYLLVYMYFKRKLETGHAIFISMIPFFFSILFIFFSEMIPNIIISLLLLILIFIIYIFVYDGVKRMFLS